MPHQSEKACLPGRGLSLASLLGINYWDHCIGKEELETLNALNDLQSKGLNLILSFSF